MMVRKRKHGTDSVPISFSTQYFHLLKRQENRSEYIDAAIRHYDETVMWRARSGKNELDARVESLKKHLFNAHKHAVWMDELAPPGLDKLLLSCIALIDSHDHWEVARSIRQGQEEE